MYRYVALMFDPNSPLIEMTNDFWERKFESAETAGFPMDRNGKFDKKVDEMILGQKRTPKRLYNHIYFIHK